jgi:sodium-dependent dicarboxylate transporter 2/3/5
VLAAAVVFALPFMVTLPGLSPEGHRLLAVFLAAIVLWVTEAIPLHATAMAIIAAEVLLISDQALVTLSPDFEAPEVSAFYSALAHPVIVLFLGGFFIAEAARKYRLDRNLARVLLRPFGDDPRRIMLGIMCITAGLSMFMSNTATTATMMAIVVPVLGSLPPGDRLRTGVAIAVPIAANVGGIGTPVGTPPNAIAIGALRDAGIQVSFVQWMAMAVPFMLVVLVAAWLLLASRFASQTTTLTLRIDARFDRSRPATIFYATAATTIVLWLTEPLHGLPSSIVGLVPVVVLLATRVFSVEDMRNLQWHVLWLVAGGIALGTGVAQTGLDVWLVGLISWEAVPAALLLALLALVALTMSTIISNSATANLLIPIGLTLAVSPAIAFSPILAGAIIALGCSLAMALPVSTPPNAIAYATGTFSTRDLVMVGVPIGLAGALFVVAAAPWLWSALGLVPD